MTINTVYFKNVSKNSVFAKLFEISLLKKNFYIGEVILVKVIKIDYNFVIVDAGLKSEGFISINEFKNDKGVLEVTVGDLVYVVLESFDNGLGYTIFSRDKAKRLASWIFLERALLTGQRVIGTVLARVKGGLTVVLKGIRAFLPGSLMDIKPVKDANLLEGQTLEFKVIKLDCERNNVVVSRKAVIEEIRGLDRNKIIKILAEGIVIKGTVKNITDYGVFIDLGGIDGLIHITDLSWKRIVHPSEVLKIGQEIFVKVLKFDKVKKKVSLGLKQLKLDPWHKITQRYPKGTHLLGRVINIADYGIFIQIEDGIEGLVHISEMNLLCKKAIIEKTLRINTLLEVMILNINEKRRRISLGMKFFTLNPWKDFFRRYKRGSKVKGIIKSITDFGVFINLYKNIDGLIYISNLSWDIYKIKKILNNFKKYKLLNVKILDFDIKKQKISLGIKQFNIDPFEKFIKLNKIGSEILGFVYIVKKNKIIIKLTNDGVYGYLKIRNTNKGLSILKKIFKIGRKMNFIIISFKIKKRVVHLSLENFLNRHIFL